MPPDAAVMEIGKALHDALPAPSRNPVKLVDA